MPGRRNHPAVNLPAFLFGFLLATSAGLGYHLVRGGPLSRLALYLASAWIAFAAGHVVGGWLGLTLLRLGAINLFSAALATLLALVLADVLAPPTAKADRGRRKPPLSPRS